MSMARAKATATMYCVDAPLSEPMIKDTPKSKKGKGTLDRKSLLNEDNLFTKA